MTFGLCDETIRHTAFRRRRTSHALAHELDRALDRRCIRPQPDPRQCRYAVRGAVFQWKVAWLLWPFWIQSVIIGVYARKRMLDLAQFSTEGFTSNERPVPENEQG